MNVTKSTSDRPTRSIPSINIYRTPPNRMTSSNAISPGRRSAFTVAGRSMKTIMTFQAAPVQQPEDARSDLPPTSGNAFAARIALILSFVCTLIGVQSSRFRYSKVAQKGCQNGTPPIFCPTIVPQWRPPTCALDVLTP